MAYFKSKSYNPKACCGADCTYEYRSTLEQPCWGDVVVVGEDCNSDYSDCWWIHACQGHIDFYDEDKPEYKYEQNI